MRKESNTVEMRVKTTEEVLKLIKRRYRDRSTMNRTPITKIQVDRQVRRRKRICLTQPTNYS